MSMAEKKNWIKQLKEYRAAILNVTDPGDEALKQELKGLVSLLWEIEQSSADEEVKKVVQKTTDEIRLLGLYDTTRANVCKWVQTIICELSNKK